MKSINSKIKKVTIFCGSIVNPGGEEKLLFEQALYLKKRGIKIDILTYIYSSDAYGDAYKMNINIIDKKINSKNVVLRSIYKILALRKKIKDIRPDIIISHHYGDCVHLFFATLFIHVPYVVHIPETIFRNHKSLEIYALIHRKVFSEIRESTVGGREFIPPIPPKLGLIKRIMGEFSAALLYIGVRKATKIFVLSNQMKWEVDKLYGKGSDTIVVKGAFPSEIFDYKPKRNFKEKLGLTDKRMILNVNRLDPRKRVDLVIKAFKQICDELDDVVLVICGIGPEEENLKALVKDLNIQDKVKFMGYIPEEERKDYYACCDVFVHPNWADFAIAPYEALALQKKVVWSSEMEVDENIAKNKHIFVADPTIDNFAEAIKNALTTEVTEDDDVSRYTWDEYFGKICAEMVG